MTRTAAHEHAELAALRAEVAALEREVERVAWQFKTDKYPQRVRDLEGVVARQGRALAELMGAVDVSGMAGRAAMERAFAALDAPAPDAGEWVTGGGTLEVLPWGWRCGACGSSGTGGHRGHRCRPFAPAPPATGPLPGPVANAVAGLRASAGLLRSKDYTASAVALEMDARALAAWARAQQQPAMDAEVREAMREAAAVIEAMDQYIGRGGLGGWTWRGATVARMSARLRELAGERGRGRGFATIPGWQAGEP